MYTITKIKVYKINKIKMYTITKIKILACSTFHGRKMTPSLGQSGSQCCGMLQFWMSGRGEIASEHLSSFVLTK